MNPTTITHNLQSIREKMRLSAENCGRDPATIRLVAVSKRHPTSKIREAITAGQKLFGESYIQEAAGKCQELETEAAFHFIGHLQSNKAKIAAELFTMIESVDRFKLAKGLQKHLEKLDKTIDILIQVNIGNDPNKSGVVPEKTEELLQQITSLSRIRARGLMTIPPLCIDPLQTRKHFKSLRILSEKLQKKMLFFDNDSIELSMGMSQDYPIAIEEGATLVRVGTAVFGNRPLSIPG